MSTFSGPSRPSGLLSRRSLLKLGGAAATAAVARHSLDGLDSGSPSVLAARHDSTNEILENGAGKFRVEIDGAHFPDVHEVLMDPFSIDAVEQPGDKADYRVYGPGDAHYGSITIRSRVGKDSRELYQWWLDCSQGKNIRKSISVICLKRDGSEARRFNFLECFPTRWDPGEYSPSSNVACETVVCKMGRVELA